MALVLASLAPAAAPTRPKDIRRPTTTSDSAYLAGDARRVTVQAFELGGVMADIAQVLATYDALAGVAIGASLTYGFGALNRRHQEAREDKTRWYAARREAYARFLDAVTNHTFVSKREDTGMDDRVGASTALISAFGAVRLVGSPDAVQAAEHYLSAFLDSEPHDASTMRAAMRAFVVAARKDLGHSEPASSPSEVERKEALDASEERP
jgi:hypothetical protein